MSAQQRMPVESARTEHRSEGEAAAEGGAVTRVLCAVRPLSKESTKRSE